MSFSTPSQDFLGTQQQEEKKASRQTIILAIVFSILIAIVAGLGAAASYRSVTRGTHLIDEVSNLPGLFGFGDTGTTSSTQPGTTTPEADERMNIMLFGIGGDGHEGSQLTDTIIFTSIDTKNKKVGMLSIPRDSAYPLGGGRYEKINAVQAYAELENPGQGAQIASKNIGDLLGVQVDHYVKIDFRGFAALVDAIGGVEIDVERSFVDPQYPTNDEKWQTISFKKGKQTMNGETVLKYVRSRHGTNGEGSDFARNRRQQLAILAIRQKILSLGTFSDPKKLANVYTAISKHIQSDLNIWDAIKLAPLIQDFDSKNIISHVLTDDADGELVPANINGAFMLFPKVSDWSEIRQIAQNPFETKEERLGFEKPAEPISVEIKNGTFRTGFAAQIAGKLEKQGYTIGQFGNARRRDYPTTTIYDFTGGKKPAELEKLKKFLSADVSPLPTSQNLDIKTSASSTDFLIVLGEAQSSTNYADPQTP